MQARCTSPDFKARQAVSLRVGISGCARSRFGDEKPISLSFPACAIGASGG